MENDACRRQNRIPGWYRFFIGDIEATIVSDGRMRPFSAEDLFPTVPKQMLYSILRRHYLPLSGMIMEQNCLALKRGNKFVLFDTGVGYERIAGGGGDETGRLLSSMSAAGIDRNDVCAVMLTHAHSDHCWGLVDEAGNLNFPNAEVFISKAEFDFWTDERRLSDDNYIGVFVAGARRNLLPYRDRLTFVVDGREAMPGVTPLASPGHSIGHTSYLISSAEANYLFLGDVAHSTALHFENPAWEFAFDLDPRQAGETRRRVLEFAVCESLSLIGYHFLFPGVGNIRRDGQSFAYIQAPILHR